MLLFWFNISMLYGIMFLSEVLCTNLSMCAQHKGKNMSKCWCSDYFVVVWRSWCRCWFCTAGCLASRGPAALQRDNTWAVITEQQTALLEMKEAQWGQSKALTAGGHYSERLLSVAALQLTHSPHTQHK